jgi:hypothetical protein
LHERRVLRVGERTGFLIPEAAAVLEAWSEDCLEECGRYFVVLRVGDLGLSGDGALPKCLHVAF